MGVAHRRWKRNGTAPCTRSCGSCARSNRMCCKRSCDRRELPLVRASAALFLLVACGAARQTLPRGPARADARILIASAGGVEATVTDSDELILLERDRPEQRIAHDRP